VIIKAAGGGGGRGMRVVHTEAALIHAVQTTRAEAGAALREVLEHDPRNPYYLWVAYGVIPAS